MRQLTHFFTFALLLLVSTTLSSQELTLVSQVSLGGGTDIWGHTNPLVAGTEYATVGSSGGVAIVDVSDPLNPMHITTVNVPNFDHKVWNNYLYAVTGGPGANAGKIADISDPENPVVVGSFESAHNIFITDDGHLIAEFSNPPLVIYDLTGDPASPEQIWSGGNEGHDAVVIGSRMFDFHGYSGTRVFDITDYANPVQLGVTIDDPQMVYHHHGWTDPSGQYLYICDELANGSNADITIWDISDMDDPQRVGDFTDTGATVHNLFVKDDYAFVSYYGAGVRVFDISDPASLVLVAENGSIGSIWGIYPYLPSGTIIASGGIGLHVFTFEDNPVSIEETSSAVPRSSALAQNFPNPFNPSTRFGFQISDFGFVTVKVFDVQGRLVKTILEKSMSAGSYTAGWDGRDNLGEPVPSGTYIYRLTAGGVVESRRMTLVK